MRVVYPRSVVAAWAPERAGADADRLNEVAELVSEAGTRTQRSVTGLRDSRAWTGDAQSAASDWAVAEVQRTEDVSRATKALASVINTELQAIGGCRVALLRAVAAAEADGLTVDEQWAVFGVDAEVLQRHEREVRRCLSELIRADGTAAQAVARCLEEFTADTGMRGFVPVAIGLAFLIDAAVSALIATGVVSAGAILFALVDEFGIDAWDTIESAVPSSFFEDAGPVDEAGVKEQIQDATVPGRNRPVRQVATEEQLRDLWDSLTAEGRAVDSEKYPGKVMELPDGTRVRLRETSQSGGATIDISYPSGGGAKVHTK